MTQTWCAEGYARNARYVSDLGAPVLALLNPQPGERILDLGCGDGALTRKLHDKGCTVTGIDSSPDMIQAASSLGLSVSLQSAYEIDFHEEFDAVFSNAVLHWLKDPDRVIRNVVRALRRGGRFVAEFGGHRCCETIQTALIAELAARGHDGWAVNPWYFPTTEDYGTRLAAAGFTVAYIAIIPRPTPLPAGIDGFLETFARSFTAALPADERQAYVTDVRNRLKPLLCGTDGVWVADYTRLRVEAYKNG